MLHKITHHYKITHHFKSEPFFISQWTHCDTHKSVTGPYADAMDLIERATHTTPGPGKCNPRKVDEYKAQVVHISYDYR